MNAKMELDGIQTAEDRIQWWLVEERSCVRVD
jgi:hypothetical protein